jgi:hypothetical protein
VTDLPRQRDRFGNDVIGRNEMVSEPEVLERAEDFNDARVVGVSLGDKREQESRIEKNHTFGMP